MLTAENFIAPSGVHGDLDPALFPRRSWESGSTAYPDSTIVARIEAYITQSEVKAATANASVREAAQIAWVNFRGWNDAAILMDTEPHQITTDDGKTARTISKDQVERMRERAQAYLSEFNGYIPNLNELQDRPLVSQTIRVKPVW